MLEHSALVKIALGIPPVVLAVTMHEYAHGWVAYRLGDPTAKNAGRLSLNPLKHIDPLMTILLPALTYWLSGIMFGAAKPVPVNWSNLNRPKQDMGWVALAGPMSNLLMAIGWTAILKLNLASGAHSLLSNMVLYSALVGIAVNSVLMWINLIPVPPADGGRIMVSLLPNQLAWKYARIESLGFFPMMAAMLVLIFSGVLYGLVMGFVTLLSSLFLMRPGYLRYLLESNLF